MGTAWLTGELRSRARTKSPYCQALCLFIVMPSKGMAWLAAGYLRGDTMHNECHFAGRRKNNGLRSQRKYDPLNM